MVNIALKRPYTRFPDPNYYDVHGKKPDKGWVFDGELTDGKRYTGEGYELWHKEKWAVAWQGHGSQFVAITVALEREEPIQGVAYSTAGSLERNSNVLFPEAIYILVSDNGEDFYPVGDLVSLNDGSPPAPGGQLYTFKTTKLETRGRYVRLVVIPAGVNNLPNGGSSYPKYTVVDEIEVYRSDKSLSSIQKPKGPSLANPFSTGPSGMTMVGINRRLRNDLSVVEGRIADLNKTAHYKTQIDNLRTEIDALQYGIAPEKMDFQAIVPFNELHKNIFALFAKVLKDEYGQRDLIVWTQHRYAYHTPLEVSPPTGQPASIEIVQMRNEWRAAVLNLTNATEKETIANFEIKSLPNSASFVEVFQVDCRDNFWGTLPAVPFMKLQLSSEGRYMVTLPPGMTRQVWFSVKSPKTWSATRHEGMIEINIDGNYKEEVPFVLDLHQETFPDVVDLNYGVYDYAVAPMQPCGVYRVNPNNREAIVCDLKHHLVNVPTQSGGGLNNYLDKWLGEWPEAHYYYIHLNVDKPKVGGKVVFPNGPKLSQKDATCEVKVDHQPRSGSDLEVWARKKARDIRRIRKGQVVFHLVDEPRALKATESNPIDPVQTVNLFTCIERLIRAIRSGTDHFSHFVNLGDKLGQYDNGEEGQAWKTDTTDARTIHKAATQALDVADIVTPHITQIHEGGVEALRFYHQLVAAGKQFWLYSTRDLRYDDPSVFYRLQPWHCFIYGATGYMFWGYCAGIRWDESKQDCVPHPDPTSQHKPECKTEKWNAIKNQFPVHFSPNSPGMWSPVYLDNDHQVTVTKYWEAATEGVEDYQYFFMLRERAQKTIECHAQNQDAQQAMCFLDSLYQRFVLKVASEDEIRGKNASGTSTVRPVWNGDRNPGLLDEARRDTLSWLERLRPLANWSDWESMTALPRGCLLLPLLPQIGIQNQIAASMNEDGTLAVFAIGTDKHLWHKRQQTPNGPWHEWQTMGNPPGGLVPDSIAVGKNGDGCLEVFGVDGDGAVWHKVQQRANGAWQNWVSLGKPLAGLVNPPVLKVGHNQDGSMEIFSVGNDGALWHRYQQKPSGPWQDWDSLGTPTAQRFVSSSLAVGRNQDGRLAAFAISSDVSLWCRRQLNPGGSWDRWIPMGAPTIGVELCSLAIGQNEDGRPEVFALGGVNAGGNRHLLGDIRLWHIHQQQANDSWSEWKPLASTPGNVALDHRVDIVAAQNRDGRLWVFAVGSDGALWYSCQQKPNGDWGAWNSMGPSLHSKKLAQLTGCLAAARSEDGCLKVFAIGNDGTLWYRQQQLEA